MKIGIDAHAAEREGSGNCTYINNLLLALKEIDDKNEYLLYATDKNHPFYDNFNGSRNFRIRQLPVRNPFFRIPFFLAWQTYKDSLDILHVQYNAPPFHKGKLVVTIHDLGFLHLPESFSKTERIRLKILTRITGHKSERIITGSKFSKNDIVRTYHIEPNKVMVIPHGVSTVFTSPKDSGRTREVLEKYGIKGEYFLSVGRLNPRKNLKTLVRAFCRLKESQPISHNLIIVGKGDYKTSELLQSFEMNDTSDIFFLGCVDQEDLPYLYAGAHVFVYPSLFEGVGLPVLEAMGSNVPVVTSNTTSLKEMVGDAGITVDPLDIEEITNAMLQLLTDKGLRDRCIKKGMARANSFSWEKTAEQTLRLYKDVYGLE